MYLSYFLRNALIINIEPLPARLVYVYIFKSIISHNLHLRFLGVLGKGIGSVPELQQPCAPATDQYFFFVFGLGVKPLAHIINLYLS